MYAHTYTHTRARTRTRHTCTCTSAHTHTHVHACAYIHTDTDTHTHTHTDANNPQGSFTAWRLSVQMSFCTVNTFPPQCHESAMVVQATEAHYLNQPTTQDYSSWFLIALPLNANEMRIRKKKYLSTTFQMLSYANRIVP